MRTVRRNFALFLLSTVLLVETFFSCAEGVASACKDIASNSATLRLKRNLFCDYDPSVRPTYNHKNATTVTVRLLLKTISINEHGMAADVQTWTVLSWQDEHLTWDPAEYDDIKLLHAKSNELWVPSVVANNAYGFASDSGIPYTNCWLMHDGSVNCVPAVLYSVPCISEHSLWPYDLFYCLLELRAWAYHQDEVNFSIINGKGMNINDYRKSGEWQLLMTDTFKYMETYPFNEKETTETIGVTFLFKRNSPSLAVLSSAPVTALTLMTLVTLWLDARSTERLVVACLNFVCHLICIHDIHWKMPEIGAQPPVILSFYESSLVLATIALILTSFLRQIFRATVKVPVWLSSTTLTVFQSKVGQVLLLSILDPKASATLENDAEDGANLLQARESTRETSWRYVAVVIGWIAFIAVFVAYIVLLVTCMPVNYPAQAYVNSL